MKALLAAVAVIEFVVILWLGFAVNAVPPVPAGPVDSPGGVQAGRARALLDPTAPPPANTGRRS